MADDAPPSRPSGGSGSGGGGNRRRRSRNRNRRPQGNPGQGRRPQGGGGGSSRNPSRGGSGARSQSRPPARRPAPVVAPPPPPPVLVPGGEAEERRAARRRAESLCALGMVPAAVVVLVVLGLVVGPLLGVVAAVVVGVGGGALLWVFSTTRALWVLGARPLRPDEEPRLANVVDGLCATFGLPFPDLLAVDDPLPNACSLGRQPTDAVVVVTTGLLAACDLIELEGVLAHELAHVKRGDTAVTGAALAVLGPLLLLGVAESWLARALGPGRHLAADRDAVAAVRYPPGLRDALAGMVAQPGPAPGTFFSGRGRRTRSVWLDPSVGRRDGDATGVLDDTAVRLALLEEL